VTEYNYWQDPEAAAKVLALGPANGATIQIVLADAFNQFKVQSSDLRDLRRRGNSAIRNLLPALQTYVDGLTQGREIPALPDPVGVIYALDNRLGTAESALVEVLVGVPEVARGQTIVGRTLNDRIVMIAGDAKLSELAFRLYNEPGFDQAAFELELANILFSRPDNALVVTDIDARRMRSIFLRGLRQQDTSSTSDNDADASQLGEYEHQMFVPFVVD
jgi:inosine-uridine nucleoside N-ribohydrolase